MPHYMIQVAYTPEAWGAMVKTPQDRIAAVRPAIERLGGKIEAGYMAFGEYDIVAIFSMPDNVSAAAFAMAAAAGGSCSKVRTTPLMTMQESTAAMKKATGSAYRPPTSGAASKTARKR